MDDYGAAPLTEREREIALMMADGQTNAGIADSLVLSVETVRTHARHILRKLGLRSRHQLTREMLEGPGNHPSGD